MNYTVVPYKASVVTLEYIMHEIRVHETVGVPCPLRHNLYRRYRDAILDHTDEQRDRQARKTLIERSV